jgi:DNA-binding response OmpR family regulator
MAGNVKVLLVDDNPMVLQMLRHELAELAPVQTASDGADALLKAIDDVPDLIICDYDMPGMNGRQLVEKLKTRANTARVPVILLASRADISEKLKMLQDSIEDFVEKPFFMRETIAHIKKTLDKIALEKMAREAPGESTVRGNLSQMSCMDLLQSLEMGRKSCSLLLTSDGQRCELYFTEGQISHAVYGNLKGDEAVYKVLTWTGGTFTIDFSSTSPEQTTTRSTQGLLMEGLRLLDESNRDSEANVSA